MKFRHHAMQKICGGENIVRSGFRRTQLLTRHLANLPTRPRRFPASWADSSIAINAESARGSLPCQFRSPLFSAPAPCLGRAPSAVQRQLLREYCARLLRHACKIAAAEHVHDDVTAA